MMQRIHKGPSAAHRQAGYGPVSLFAFDAVFLFYKGQELFEEKVFVSKIRFHVIEIAAATRISVGHDDHHRRGETVANGFIGDVQPFAELNPPRLVIPASVEKIQDRITSLRSFVIGREINSKLAVSFQDFAGHGQVVKNFSTLRKHQGLQYPREYGAQYDLFFHDGMNGSIK